MTVFGKQDRYNKIIMIIYLKTLEAVGKFAIIQNYIKIVKTCNSI